MFTEYKHSKPRVAETSSHSYEFSPRLSNPRARYSTATENHQVARKSQPHKMCTDIVVRYLRCRHDISDRYPCEKPRRAKQKASWCCFSSSPSRVICRVEYRTYQDPGYCLGCEEARMRKRAQKARAQARDEQERRERDQAREQARKAGQRCACGSKAVRRQGEDDGGSYIETGLYQQAVDARTVPESRAYLSAATQTPRPQNRGRHSHNAPRPVQARPPPPLSERVPLNLNRRAMETSDTRRQPRLVHPPPRQARVHSHVGRLSSWDQVLQDSGYDLGLPKIVHEASDENGEPLPDDDFLRDMEGL